MGDKDYRILEFSVPINDSKLIDILIESASVCGFSAKRVDDLCKEYGKNMEIKKTPIQHYVYLGRVFSHEIKFNSGIVNRLFIDKCPFRRESKLTKYLNEVNDKIKL